MYCLQVYATGTKVKFRICKEMRYGKEHIRSTWLSWQCHVSGWETEIRIITQSSANHCTFHRAELSLQHLVKSEHLRAGKNNLLCCACLSLLTVELLGPSTGSSHPWDRWGAFVTPFTWERHRGSEIKQPVPAHHPFPAPIPPVTAHLFPSWGSTFHFQHTLMSSVKHTRVTENFSYARNATQWLAHSPPKKRLPMGL